MRKVFIYSLFLFLPFSVGRTQTVDLDLENTPNKKERVEKFIRLKKFEVKGVDKSIVEQIRKNAISIVMGKNEYQFLIGKTDIKIDNPKVEILEIDFSMLPIKWGNNYGYYLEASLIESNTGVARRKEVRTRVPVQQAIFQSGRVMSALFGPEKIEEEIETDYEFVDQAGLDSSSNNDKGAREGKEANEAGEDQLDEADNPAALGPAQTEEDKVAEEEAAEKPKKKKNKPVSISNFESPDLDLKKRDESKDFNLNSKNRISQFQYKLAFGKESIRSVNIVDVNNDLNYLGLNLGHKMFYNGFESNMQRSFLEMRRPVSESEYDFPMRLHLGTYYHLNGLSRTIQLFAGGSYESSSFVNLAQRGGGLQSWSTTSIWAEAGVMLDFSRLSWDADLLFTFSKTLLSLTDFGDENVETTLDGNSLSFVFRQGIWRRLSGTVSLRSYSFTSLALSEFKNETQEVSIGLIYR